MNRCYKPARFGNVIEYSLHHFSDASEYRYDWCTYLQVINEGDKIKYIFTTCKSRVETKKVVSVPSFELTEAWFLAKMVALV